MSWTRIGSAEALFAGSASQFVCATIAHASPAGVGRPAGVRRSLIFYEFMPLRWREIGSGAAFALACHDGTICTLGVDEPHSLFQQMSDGSWELLLEGRASALYGGGTTATTAAGERYPVLYATDARSGAVLAYQGPVRYRHGLRHNGPVTEIHPWIEIGGPTFKLVEAGPLVGSRLSLYSLAPDRLSVWRYDGHGRAWTQIRGAAADLIGGTERLPIAIDPDTGRPEIWSGTPMRWIAFGERVGVDSPPYATAPGGRLMVDTNNNWAYHAPDGTLHLQHSFRNAFDRIVSTDWIDLGPAERAVLTRSSDLGLYQHDRHGSIWQWTLPGIRLLPPTLPDADEGEQYGASMILDGGVPPYRWTIPPWQLPHGLHLDRGMGEVPDPSAYSLDSEWNFMNVAGVPDVLAHPPLGWSSVPPDVRFGINLHVVDRLGEVAVATTWLTWHTRPAPPPPTAPTGEGGIGFAPPRDEWGATLPAIVIDPPWPAPNEPFTISWIGKNYGDVPISGGEIQDHLTIEDEVGAHGAPYDEPVPSPLLPAQEYSTPQQIDDGLPAGRYTITVELQVEVPRMPGFNVTTVVLPIEER